MFLFFNVTYHIRNIDFLIISGISLVMYPTDSFINYLAQH